MLWHYYAVIERKGMGETHIIWDTRSFVRSFTTSAKFVKLDMSGCWSIGRNMLPELARSPLPWGIPKWLFTSDWRILFLYELILDSVNYCYWYGSSDFRPNGASSVRLDALLTESFIELITKYAAPIHYPTEVYHLGSVKLIHHAIEIFKVKLSLNRFPLLDQRIHHLNEIQASLDEAVQWVYSKVQGNQFTEGSVKNLCVEEWLEFLITHFPGYGKDIFLKRAFLYIIQMYRRLGAFQKEIGIVPVPADYQLPKVLRSTGCIEYAPTLENMVDTGEFLIEDSLLECEIRAATIKACDIIAVSVGCSPAEVDTYLFNKRNQYSQNFHLTLTSNY